MKRTMPADQFMSVAESQISDLLRRHAIDVNFQTDARKTPLVRYASFARPEGEYEISIWPHDITMTVPARGQLFECYLRREWTSDTALIEAFTRRLDRFVSGGSWEEPDESGTGPIARTFKKFLTAFRQ